MSIHSKSHSRGPWVRCLALMALVSYLGGMGWFMTLCTAALAVVDGEHSVRIESRRQGFLVILGHEHLSHGSGSMHSHDWISAVLITMAADSLTPGGDHVIDLDRDPGLAARSSEASLRGSIARNLSAATFQPMTMVLPTRARAFRMDAISTTARLSAHGTARRSSSRSTTGPAGCSRRSMDGHGRLSTHSSSSQSQAANSNGRKPRPAGSSALSTPDAAKGSVALVSSRFS